MITGILPTLIKKLTKYRTHWLHAIFQMVMAILNVCHRLFLQNYKCLGAACTMETRSLQNIHI